MSRYGFPARKGCLVVLLVTAGAGVAPAGPLRARDLLATAIAARRSGDVGASYRAFRQAVAEDPAVQSLPDSGVGDWLLATFARRAPVQKDDAAFLRDWAFLLMVKGESEQAARVYRRALALDPSTDRASISRNLATLEDWIRQEQVVEPAAEDSGSASGESSCCIEPGPDDDPGSPAGSDPRDQEIEALRLSISERDRQLESLQKEKEELTRQIADLEKANRQAQVWKARGMGANMSGSSDGGAAATGTRPAAGSGSSICR